VSPLFIQVLGGCFAAAFLLVMALNRRPVLITVFVPLIAFGWLIGQNWRDVSVDGGEMEAMLYALAAACGLVTAGAGSALALFFRRRAGGPAMTDRRS
jgi:hypothetical protein